MTTNRDWAYDISQKIEVGVAGKGPEEFIAEIAAALRKAKADGVRAARENLWQKKNQFYSHLNVLADQIEQGLA